MRKKKGFFAGFFRRLDIPSEVLPHGFGLALSGRERLLVYGCSEILKYGEEEILLLLYKTRLSVLGSRLLCASFDAGCVTITGEITGISFPLEAEHAY